MRIQSRWSRAQLIKNNVQYTVRAKVCPAFADVYVLQLNPYNSCDRVCCQIALFWGNENMRIEIK